MKTFFTRKRIIVAGAIVFAVLLAGAGIVYAANNFVDQISHNQMDLFNQSFAPPPEESPSVEPSPIDTAPASGTPGATTAPPITPSPTATIDPEQDIISQADQSLMKDTLHVLLIGVDYADERVNNPNAYQGKNFNSDVMLLLSINFKQNKVDMISFPRDTYAKIPEVNSTNPNSFYKLNFALSAGGGMNDKGFMNVCKSVEGILGDKRIPPVNYYIAVNMESMKELTDSIGGVDYNVDINFKIQGREYKKGMQHLSGQGVLDYCRVRKTDGTGYISEAPGDLNRVNRQKRMLVTVFKKLQKDSLISTVPKILTSMQGKAFTNMNYKQLAALALFGKDLPEEKITMKTLPNQGSEGLFVGWQMVLQDQPKRIAMLKEIYGVTVAPLYRYDAEFARLQWAYLQGEGWLREIDKWRTADAAKPPEQQKLIVPEENAKLDSMVATTKNLMMKYHDRLYKDTKPVVSSAEWKEMSTQVTHMKDLAAQMFTKAGYKPDWDINVPAVMDMKE